MARTKKTQNVDSGGWPKVSQGSHLTVITHENGRTELKWDDEALMRDVREAIANYESTVEKVVAITEEKVKATRTRKKKETS